MFSASTLDKKMLKALYIIFFIWRGYILFKMFSRISVVLILICIIFNSIILVHSTIEIDKYEINKFWDENINYDFHYQTTRNACGPACVQMVLDFYDIEPLPNQEDIALELNTTLNKYSYTNFFSKPFEDRNIEVVYNGKLNHNFSIALPQLKGNVSLNRPIILLMRYNSKHEVGHYRVVTGFNKTGIFFHDPWFISPSSYSGPKTYINNSLVEDLWNYSHNWVLILQSGQPYEAQPITLPDANIIPIFIITMIISIVVISYLRKRMRAKYSGDKYNF